MESVSDNPELNAEQIDSARPFAEVFPDLAKTIRTVELGWRSRMNDALRKMMPKRW